MCFYVIFIKKKLIVEWSGYLPVEFELRPKSNLRYLEILNVYYFLFN